MKKKENAAGTPQVVDIQMLPRPFELGNKKNIAMIDNTVPGIKQSKKIKKFAFEFW